MLRRGSHLVERAAMTGIDHADETAGDGFTLIELLIVVAVLGILAAAVIFGLNGVATTAAVTACNSDAKSTEIAVEAFHDNPKNTAHPLGYPNPSTGSPLGNHS
jgi:prepilin-type N-terminal cleavage/methylation domain-containing protein